MPTLWLPCQTSREILDIVSLEKHSWERVQIKLLLWTCVSSNIYDVKLSKNNTGKQKKKKSLVSIRFSRGKRNSVLKKRSTVCVFLHIFNSFPRPKHTLIVTLQVNSTPSPTESKPHSSTFMSKCFKCKCSHLSHDTTNILKWSKLYCPVRS